MNKNGLYHSVRRIMQTALRKPAESFCQFIKRTNPKKVSAALCKYIKKAADMAETIEMRLLPGHLTLFLVMSLVPVFIITSYTAVYFKVPLDGLIETLHILLPDAVIGILTSSINEGKKLNIGAWLATAFLLASNGIHALIVSSDALYGFKQRNYFFRRFKAIVLTVLMVAVLIFGMLIISVFDIAETETVAAVLRLLKWPGSILLLFCMIKLIYRLTPSKKIPEKYSNGGVVFTTAGWIVSTGAYTGYVKNYGNYDILYGGIANVMVLIMWVYILSYVFIIGIAINAFLYKTYRVGPIQKEEC